MLLDLHFVRSASLSALECLGARFFRSGMLSRLWWRLSCLGGRSFAFPAPVTAVVSVMRCGGTAGRERLSGVVGDLSGLVEQLHQPVHIGGQDDLGASVAGTCFAAVSAGYRNVLAAAGGGDPFGVDAFVAQSHRHQTLVA